MTIGKICKVDLRKYLSFNAINFIMIWPLHETMGLYWICHCARQPAIAFGSFETHLI